MRQKTLADKHLRRTQKVSPRASVHQLRVPLMERSRNLRNPQQRRGIVRKFLFGAVLALGLMFIPAKANASWLSEALHAWRGDRPVVTYDPGYSCYEPGYVGGYYVEPSYPSVYWSSPGWYGSYRYPGYYRGWHNGYGHYGYGHHGYGHYGYGHHGGGHYGGGHHGHHH